MFHWQFVVVKLQVVYNQLTHKIKCSLKVVTLRSDSICWIIHSALKTITWIGFSSWSEHAAHHSYACLKPISYIHTKSRSLEAIIFCTNASLVLRWLQHCSKSRFIQFTQSRIAMMCIDNRRLSSSPLTIIVTNMNHSVTTTMNRLLRSWFPVS